MKHINHQESIEDRLDALREQHWEATVNECFGHAAFTKREIRRLEREQEQRAAMASLAAIARGGK